MNSTLMNMNSTLVMNTTINASTNKSNRRRQQQQAKKKKSRNRKLQLTAVIRECYQRSSSSSSSSYETDDTESLRLLPKQNLMPSLSLFSVPTLSQVKSSQSHSKTINEEDNTSNTNVSPPPSPLPLAPLLELQRNRSDLPTSAMHTFLFDRQEEEEEDQEFFDQDLFRSTVTLPNPFQSQSKTINNEGGNTSHAVSPPPVPPPAPPLPPLELKRNRSDSPTSVMQTFLFDHQEEEVEEDAHALFDKNLFKSTVLLPNLFDDDDYDNTTNEYYEDNYYYAADHFQEETMDIGTVPTPTAEMVGVVDPSMVATILHNANSYVLDTTEKKFDDDIIVDDVLVDTTVDQDDDDDEFENEPLPVFTARDAESIVQDMILDDELMPVPHYWLPMKKISQINNENNENNQNQTPIPNWSCHYQEIKNFQALYGHCDIPSTSTTVSNCYYQQLALWKKRQQFDYYQKEHHLPGGSAMTLDRIMALEKIPGWSWW